MLEKTLLLIYSSYKGDSLSLYFVFLLYFLLRFGEDTFILLIIEIVIVLEIVRKQSGKAEQQRSTKAEKQKESKGRGKQSTRKNNKQSKQGRARRKLKEKSEADNQRSRKAEKQDKRGKAEKQKSRGKHKKYESREELQAKT